MRLNCIRRVKKVGISSFKKKEIGTKAIIYDGGIN